MASFSEFRASFSDNENTRGKQFERVCKWLLENDPRYRDKLTKVWLWDDWPGRQGADYGIDLIAKDTDNKIWAIQAKCYASEYSVTKSDVDSFLTASINKRIDNRLLIATTNRLARNAEKVIRDQNEVVPVQKLLLDGLEDASIEWPKHVSRLSTAKIRKPRKPRPHQQTAIRDVVNKLDRRGQMIMACGTGKTLTALWAAEELQAKTTLVLLPSLLLLSKTLSEWLENAKEPFAYLPVCSDESAARGSDAITLFSSDLSYPSTTDVQDIAAFLRKRGRKVIFSTYQSSPQIAAAYKKGRLPKFDLVIADEAHRCAGKVSSQYSTVLRDEAIPAKKRLFMTATPRVYKAWVKKAAKDHDVDIASMDDVEVFGPVVHRLSFGEAHRPRPSQ